jgi:cold shock CspA family protein
MENKGKVLWYVPRDGRGLLRSTHGTDLPFILPDASLDLHGGDVVAFRIVGDNGDTYAADLRLVERCIDHLLNRHHALAHLFHATINLPSPPAQPASA